MAAAGRPPARGPAVADGGVSTELLEVRSVGKTRARTKSRAKGKILVGVLFTLMCAGCSLTLASSDPTVSQSWAQSPEVVPRIVAASLPQSSIDAFLRAFLVPLGDGSLCLRDSTLGGRADFWKDAEMIEMVEDAYQTTHQAAYRRIVSALADDVLAFYGDDWLRRRWNDDAIWMVIALLRAHAITGDSRYLRVARANFDRTYARSWSHDFGGGLWLTSRRTQKNATTTAPGVIAAASLYRETHDAAYYREAIGLYRWMRACLFDATTGKVLDHVSLTADRGVVWGSRAHTSNQGTFIGAADLLYRLTGDPAFLEDARGALDYVRRDLSRGGFIPSEGGTGDRDGGGFNGIFARYAVSFVLRYGLVAYLPWLRLNAEAALAHRDARGLMDHDWSMLTSSGRLSSFDCSSAVELVVQLAGHAL